MNSLTPLPSESVNLKLFRLPKADSFLAGIVKDPKGSLVAGAFVGVEDMAVPPATTDTSGHFRINGVPKGNHRIYINKGSEIRNLELMAGKDGQVLILKSDFPTEPPSGTAEPAEKGLEVGGRAVEFETGAWLNSKPLRMSELRGKVVVLDFWGISCAPCVKALPGVERMAKRFAGQQVVVIGVHDCTTNAKLLSAFSKKKGLTYALTIDKGTVKDGFGKTCSKYKIAGTPAIIVIDKQGKIVGMPDSPERAEQMINHLLH